jgi:hypothetical protein
MDCQVYPACEQRFFQFLREHTFATDHGERISIYVARSLNDFNANGERRIEDLEFGLNQAGLCERKLRTARTDDKMLFHGMNAVELFFEAEDIAPRLNCFSIARVVRASHVT